MFLEYYGLREQPFGFTPDPRFLYFGATHREALASLSYGIESGCGFLALIAPPGMGKTTLLFHLLQYWRSSAQTVFLFQTQCGSRELFRHLLNDLGIDSGDQDLAAMHESLNSVLIANARKGRRVVLVIDEAQNLRDSVLETVRLLSDFETPQAKLLQIVLSGQPQLADKLSQPNLTQLRQRISVFSRLQPFTRVETMVYLEYRLCRAGYSGPPLFSFDAVELIATHSKGFPRNINNLCFNALTLGFAKRQKQIDATTMCEVLADLELEGLSTHHEPAPETSEDALSSFDGISPSNELTYQDFHDAVRSAWGNGAPVTNHNEDKPAQDNLNWTSPNSAPRPANATIRMSLETQGSSTTSFELSDQQEGNLNNNLASSPNSVASAVALAEQDPPDELSDESQNELVPTPVTVAMAAEPATGLSRPERQLAQLETRQVPLGVRQQPVVSAVPPQPSVAEGRNLEVLLAPWGAVIRTLQDAYKKGTSSPAKARAIRGGTVIAVAFALTVGSLFFAWQLHEITWTSLKVELVSPSQVSIAPLQAALALHDTRSSNLRHNKMPVSSPNQRNQPAVIDVETVRTLGGARSLNVGKFNPKVSRPIQFSKLETGDPDLMIAGTHLLLPSLTVRSDFSTPSAGEALNRSKEQQ
jgi:general secretion pathway protein A